MSQLLIKALISGLLIALASELARRSSLLGAALVSLPLLSILALVWLWREERDPESITAFSHSILLLLPPSALLFLALPLLLRPLGFTLALLSSCLLTGLGYLGWIWLAARLGWSG